MMLLKLLQRLDRRRFSPIVVSLTSNGAIGEKIQQLHVPVHILGMNSTIPNPVLLYRAVKIIREHRTNLVHTWMYHADLFGAFAARLVGVSPIAWGIRQSNLSPGLNKSSTLLVMKICSMLSRSLPMLIFSNSTRAMNAHCEIGYSPQKMKIIPNGFDLRRFAPDPAAKLSVRRELKLSKNVFMVGVVGRFDPQKNHLGFIEAARMVRRENSRCQFLLVGPGIDRGNDELNKAILRSGFEDCFHLLGCREDIARLMSSFDLLALPSLGEAFPNVVGEAMASETPCVVTDVGDAAEIVGDTGRVVPAGDMTGLASGILQILSLSVKQRRQLGRLARERIERKYEIGLVIRQYEETYQSMLA